jgi:uncharacterized protein
MERDRREMVETTIDNKRFGPWALITGASSGIGKEFARQIAALGINLVLVARREAVLREVGAELAGDFGVEHRVLALDLTGDNFIRKLALAADDLDIGLVVSNAGTAQPGEFVTKERDELLALLRLNTLAHLEIAHHFSARLSARKSGGMLFVGAMGSEIGIPYMANEAASKAYVQSFAQALHFELKPLGVHAHQANESRAMCGRGAPSVTRQSFPGDSGAPKSDCERSCSRLCRAPADGGHVQENNC